MVRRAELNVCNGVVRVDRDNHALDFLKKRIKDDGIIETPEGNFYLDTAFIRGLSLIEYDGRYLLYARTVINSYKIDMGGTT